MIARKRWMLCTLAAVFGSGCDPHDGDALDARWRDGDDSSAIPIDPDWSPELDPLAPPVYPGPSQDPTDDGPPHQMPAEPWGEYAVPEAPLPCDTWHHETFSAHATATALQVADARTHARTKARNVWSDRFSAWKQEIECPGTCATAWFDDRQETPGPVGCDAGPESLHRCTAGHIGTAFAVCGDRKKAGKHVDHQEQPLGPPPPGTLGPELEFEPVSDEPPEDLESACKPIPPPKYITAEGRGVGYWWLLARFDAAASAAHRWNEAADEYVQDYECPPGCGRTEDWRIEVTYPAGYGDVVCAEFSAGDRVIYDCGAAAAGRLGLACFPDS